MCIIIAYVAADFNLHHRAIRGQVNQLLSNTIFKFPVKNLLWGYLCFLCRIFETERKQVDMRRFLAMHGACVDRLRQELVDAIRRLVVHR